MPRSSSRQNPDAALALSQTWSHLSCGDNVVSSPFQCSLTAVPIKPNRKENSKMLHQSRRPTLFVACFSLCPSQQMKTGPSRVPATFNQTRTHVGFTKPKVGVNTPTIHHSSQFDSMPRTNFRTGLLLDGNTINPYVEGY